MDAFTLKLIAIAAMLCDHLAWAFVPTYSILGQLLHIIGRITGPTMCFFIAEGYFHTRDLGRYARRLLVFALVSHVPFLLFENAGLPGSPAGWLQGNVIYTLLLGLLALHACKTYWPERKGRAVLCVLLLCLAATLCDWSLFGVLFVVVFGVFRGSWRRQVGGFCAVAAAFVLYVFSSVPLTLLAGREIPQILVEIQNLGGVGMFTFYSVFFQLGVFVPLLLLRRYNGKKGGETWGAAGRWMFYVFYPAHLLVIGLVRMAGRG